MINLECKFCGSDIEVSRSWIVQNGRVFCNSCCKAFEVRLGYVPKIEEDAQPAQENTKVEEVEKEEEREKQAVALEELEKEMDKAVDDWSWGF